jgi:uncharacterized lipoprotein
MRTQEIMTKCTLIALISMGLMACSIMPSTSGIFVDQKEAYKNAHELPSLELPPELVSESTAIKADSKTDAVRVVPPVKQNAIVNTTPLNDESKTGAEIINIGEVTYLLVHDSYRNTWRKIITALEELEYDIEDKNREENKVYLNIPEEGNDPGMLSSLTFWKSESTIEYLVVFKEYSDGVAVKVQNSEGVLVDNDVSKRIYADLLSKLTK